MCCVWCCNVVWLFSLPYASSSILFLEGVSCCCYQQPSPGMWFVYILCSPLLPSPVAWFIKLIISIICPSPVTCAARKPTPPAGTARLGNPCDGAAERVLLVMEPLLLTTGCTHDDRWKGASVSLAALASEWPSPPLSLPAPYTFGT